MNEKKSILGFTGIAIGATALMLALIHFWAGPFSPKPSLEEIVAEKAVSIRDATLAALKGEKVAAPPPQDSQRYDLDRIASVATSAMGGLAVILGVLGVALKEPIRVTGGAAILGVGAIAFQFTVVALGLLVLAILVSAVIGELDFG